EADDLAARPGDVYSGDGVHQRVDLVVMHTDKREHSHLVLSGPEDANVVHQAALVQRHHRLGADLVAARCVNEPDAWGTHPAVTGSGQDRVLDHLPALVRFGDDLVGLVAFVKIERGIRPRVRRDAAAPGVQHVKLAVLTAAGD